MSAYNTTLLDEDDNEIYPKTLAENVYDGNTRMDQKVDGIRTDLGNPSSASAVTGADAFSKISKLNSDLTAHTLEASIDISSYTAWGNPYNCPKDGYIYIQASAANSYVYAYVHQQGVATISASAIYSSTAASNTISVRKGMKIVIAGSGTFTAAFHGLS